MKLLKKRETLDSKFLNKDLSPKEYLSLWSSLIDQEILHIANEKLNPNEYTVLAVGRYGAGELFPFSDIDLLILVPEESINLQQIEDFFSEIWNLGIKISPLVHTENSVHESIATDNMLETSILTARYLYGSTEKYKSVKSKFQNGHDPKKFFYKKIIERNRRHEKYDNSPYALEPNCKETPGALRDLDLVKWLALSNGLKPDWDALVEANLLSSKEAKVLAICEEDFNRLRILLHLLNKKADDRLLFHLQDEVAIFFDKLQVGRRPSEPFMQSYYKVSSQVILITEFFIKALELQINESEKKEVISLDEDFVLENNFLKLKHADAFKKSPELILKAFYYLQTKAEINDFSLELQRQIWSHRKLIDADVIERKDINQIFIQILSYPEGIVRTLRRLDKFKVLHRLIPQFNNISGQMQYDLYHAYTVDQHTLQVIKYLRRFTMPEYDNDHPMAAKIMRDFSNSWLLYIAAIFHDIAKGRGGDHSELGAQDISEYAIRIGLDKADRELLVFLVRNHLLMSTYAQKKDTSHPEIVLEFVNSIKNIRYLNALYLLTIADIKGTNPKLWNSWRANLIDKLYEQASQFIHKESEEVEGGNIANRKNEALNFIDFESEDQNYKKSIQELWGSFGADYFYRNEAQVIAWHANSILNAKSKSLPLVFCESLSDDHFRVGIWAKDRPRLFLDILGFFHKHKINILDAKIHTSTNGFALDTIICEFGPYTEMYRDKVKFIEEALSEDIATSKDSVIPEQSLPINKEMRRMKVFPIRPEVNIEQKNNSSSFVMTIISNDRPGILYHIAKLLDSNEINLEMAKILTLGQRVEDVFLISSEKLYEESFRNKLIDEIYLYLQSIIP